MSCATINITAALCLGLLNGCANSVIRATPEEMRADPGATARFSSSTSYDRAYTKTLEQLKTCFERGGTVHISVFGEKSVKEAHVSMSLASMLGYRILATVAMLPSNTGTDVAVYAANDIWKTKLQTGLIEWLIAGTRNCPDDLPIADHASLAGDQ